MLYQNSNNPSGILIWGSLRAGLYHATRTSEEKSHIKIESIRQNLSNEFLLEEEENQITWLDITLNFAEPVISALAVPYVIPVITYCAAFAMQKYQNFAHPTAPNNQLATLGATSTAIVITAKAFSDLIANAATELMNTVVKVVIPETHVEEDIYEEEDDAELNFDNIFSETTNTPSGSPAKMLNEILEFSRANTPLVDLASIVDDL